MIKEVTKETIKEVVDFAYQMNQDPTTSCKASYLKEKEIIEKRFIQTIIHQEEMMIAEYSDNELKGVFSYLIDSESKYLECICGFYKNEASLENIINYLKKNYNGWHIDFVYPKENTMVLNVLRKVGGSFDPLQWDMELIELNKKPLEFDLKIIHFDEKYFEGYKKIHNTECYWVADRIVNALDKFNIYLAFNNDEVIGYLDISKNGDIYDLYVSESFRTKGYGRALMQIACENALKKNKKVILNVNDDNETAYYLYKSLGFREFGNSITIGVDL